MIDEIDFWLVYLSQLFLTFCVEEVAIYVDFWSPTGITFDTTTLLSGAISLNDAILQ